MLKGKGFKMIQKKRIRDILFPEGTKTREWIRKANKKLHKTPDEFGMWIKLNEPTKQELKEQRKFEFGQSPKISIIVPMYNTPKKFLKELVHSVINQTYGNWELCLADGSKERRECIEKICKKDKRIIRFIGGCYMKLLKEILLRGLQGISIGVSLT